MPTNIEANFQKLMDDIVELTKKHDISIEQFCAVAEVGRSFMFRYRNGEMPETIKILSRLETALKEFNALLEDES
ncbi:hypothetical protein [Morganella phage Mecenats66]|nr:hypothetical protein [Morganella phage Mecenats66]